MNTIPINQLLAQLAEQQQQLQHKTFLAPCIQSGLLRISIHGLIHTLTPKLPESFEGWGLFRALDNESAYLVKAAEDKTIIANYLKRLSPLRLLLITPIKGKTWLAYPANEADAKQRFNFAQPVKVHLVENANAFATIIAGYDGASWWFDHYDRRSNSKLTSQLQQASQQGLAPEQLQLQQLTPELKIAYQIHWRKQADYLLAKKVTDSSQRLKQALALAGGQLDYFQDKGDYWLVNWQTKNGDAHSSAISKKQLTVISAGICLDDQDSDFDLQSLVDVVEKQPEDPWD